MDTAVAVAVAVTVAAAVVVVAAVVMVVVVVVVIVAVAVAVASKGVVGCVPRGVPGGVPRVFRSVPECSVSCGIMPRWQKPKVLDQMGGCSAATTPACYNIIQGNETGAVAGAGGIG